MSASASVPAESATMDAMFARFMEMMSSAAARAAPSLPVPVPYVPRGQVRLNWSGLSELSTTEAEGVDAWFLTFECFLVGQQVTEEQWLSRFVECPLVPANLKSRVRVAIDESPMLPATSSSRIETYSDLRRSLLAEFGPVEPVSLYKRRMANLRCATAKEAKERLTELLELHNRAARDDERAILQPFELCYNFIDALGPALGDYLEANYPFAITTPQPLEHLFKMAVAKERTESKVAATLLAQVEDSAEEVTLLARRERKRHHPSRAGSWPEKVLAVDSRPATNPGRCLGCGGTCAQRRSCPAAARTCHKCGKTGHYASVCQAGDRQAGINPNFAGRSFRQAFIRAGHS